MTEIQNPKHVQDLQEQTFKTCLGHAQRRRLRRVLDIEIWDLFVIWCLLFEILTIGACVLVFA